jgi:hypothetical protein
MLNHQISKLFILQISVWYVLDADCFGPLVVDSGEAEGNLQPICNLSARREGVISVMP